MGMNEQKVSNDTAKSLELCGQAKCNPFHSCLPSNHPFKSTKVRIMMKASCDTLRTFSACLVYLFWY